MSKTRRELPPKTPLPPEAQLPVTLPPTIPELKPASLPEESSSPERVELDSVAPGDGGDRVPAHRRCPLCWTGQRGKGNAYSKSGNRRYYRCGSCAHTWTATVTLEVTRIEHRRVELEQR